MHTIIETDSFLAAAKNLLTASELEALFEVLAANPEAGSVMQGTGGFRKLRLAREGSGKRGGYRVVYFYYNEGLPVFLFTVYAKSEKENLTKAQQNTLYGIANEYKKYGE